MAHDTPHNQRASKQELTKKPHPQNPSDQAYKEKHGGTRVGRDEADREWQRRNEIANQTDKSLGNFVGPNDSGHR